MHPFVEIVRYVAAAHYALPHFQCPIVTLCGIVAKPICVCVVYQKGI